MICGLHRVYTELFRVHKESIQTDFMKYYTESTKSLYRAILVDTESTQSDMSFTQSLYRAIQGPYRVNLE